MIDRLGEDIKISDVVLILKTPVVREHEFIEGVVVKITSKTVHVHVPNEDIYWSGGVSEKIYKRQPYQIIKVK